ncbi:MAG: Rhodanese-related sulfurtransferase [Marteilia pararefringens]
MASDIVAVSSSAAASGKEPSSRLDSFVDLAHLYVSDANALGVEFSGEPSLENEKLIKETTLNSVNMLYNELKRCEKVSSKNGQSTHLVLPSSKLKFPRQKEIPMAPKLTKWQQFALKKGIKPKHKKPSIVFDERKQEWVRRYGFKGANTIQDKEAVEINEDQIGEDINPWRDEKKLKRDRVAKTEMNQIRNLVKRQKDSSKRPIEKKTKLAQIGVKKSKLKKDMNALRTSTASLGKFQKKIGDDKPDKAAKNPRKVYHNLLLLFLNNNCLIVELRWAIGTIFSDLYITETLITFR